MKLDNPFDKKLEIGYIPENIKSSAIVVNDTLELAWASAKSVFEDQAKPEHALQILALILERCQQSIDQQYTRNP